MSSILSSISLNPSPLLSEVARHAEEYSDEAISDVITPIKAEPLSPSQEPLTETLTLSQLT